MKISGSERVEFNSVTNMGLVAAERRAIDETTAKLSREGKTVLNIIHGTPWNTPVGVFKDLTFLWEGDDTHPLYLAQKKREQEELQIRQARVNEINQQQRKYDDCKRRFADLQQRISAVNAGTLAFDEHDPRITRIVKGVLPYLLYNGFMLFVTIYAELKGFLFILCFLITSALLWFYIALVKDKETESEKKARKAKVDAENAKRLSDQKILDQLKEEKYRLEKEVEVERTKLENLKQRYNM